MLILVSIQDYKKISVVWCTSEEKGPILMGSEIYLFFLMRDNANCSILSLKDRQKIQFYYPVITQSKYHMFKSLPMGRERENIMKGCLSWESF